MTSLVPSLSRWRKTAVLTAVVAGLATGSATAATYLFDFGGTGNGTASPDANGNHWNNVGPGIADSDTGLLAGVVASTSDATAINLQMISRFNGINENGTQDAGSATTLGYPVSATRDSYYGNTAEFTGLSNVFPSFKFTGLSAMEVYDFTFYASRTGVGDIRTTDYSVTGANNGISLLDAANNQIGIAEVIGIIPDGAGEITININPSATNNNGTTLFTYLGVLEVTSSPVPEPATGAALLLGGLGLAARRRRF